jgi:cytochrome P450
MEAEVVFNEVLDRFPHLRIASDWSPRWMRSSLMRRLEHLPVRSEGRRRSHQDGTQS